MDSLRTIAVLMVAYSHWMPRQFHLGLPFGTGVQLFFVLSGFLITGILLDNLHHKTSSEDRFLVLKNFYARRSLRIFPLFYIALFVSILIDVKPVREVWYWHFAFLSDIYNFLYYKSLPAWGRSYDPLGHLWSLGVEQQFYIVWPLFILFVPQKKLKGFFICTILSAPLCSFLLSAILKNVHNIHYFPLCNVDALGIGALLSYFLRYEKNGKWSPEVIINKLFYVGIIGSFVPLILLIGNISPFHIKNVGHFFMVILYGWLVLKASIGFDGIIGKILNNSIMLYLGKISYGFYVYHYFTGWIGNKLVATGTLPNSVWDLWQFRCIIQLAMTVMLAAVSWHFYENPINNLKKHFPLRRAKGFFQRHVVRN